MYRSKWYRIVMHLFVLCLRPFLHFLAVVGRVCVGYLPSIVPQVKLFAHLFVASHAWEYLRCGFHWASRQPTCHSILHVFSGVPNAHTVVICERKFGLLYESPSGNQVDGLPLVLHYDIGVFSNWVGVVPRHGRLHRKWLVEEQYLKVSDSYSGKIYLNYWTLLLAIQWN